MLLLFFFTFLFLEKCNAFFETRYFYFVSSPAKLARIQKILRVECIVVMSGNIPPLRLFMIFSL